MKKQLLISLAVISTLNCFAQSTVNCNNVTYYADTFYISVGNTILSDTIYYNDTLGIAYPAHCLHLSDTSIISASTIFSSDSCSIFTGLQQNSFDDTVYFEYLITFHSTAFSNNTIVNGYFQLSKIEFNDTILDCYFPVTIILENTTGADELIETQKTKVYPNPAFNNLNIQNNSSQVIQFSFYNSLGEQVISKSVTGKTGSVDLSSFPNGIYFYKITSDKDITRNGKIIKQ